MSFDFDAYRNQLVGRKEFIRCSHGITSNTQTTNKFKSEKNQLNFAKKAEAPKEEHYALDGTQDVPIKYILAHLAEIYAPMLPDLLKFRKNEANPIVQGSSHHDNSQEPDYQTY